MNTQEAVSYITQIVNDHLATLSPAAQLATQKLASAALSTVLAGLKEAQPDTKGE